MFKLHRPPLPSTAKQTKHEKEMDALRKHHEKVMHDNTMRQNSLVHSGVFVFSSDGSSVSVARPYRDVIKSKHAA